MSKHALGAIIPAAGLGERLQCVGSPKPLVKIGGLTLLERTIRTLRLGGVDGRIVVVVGHRGDEVSKFAASRKLDVVIVTNPDYQRGNGTSVMAGLDHMPERFVVAMVDHLHPPQSVKMLLECDGDFVAAVDTKPRFADVEEATKVKLEGDRILDIGKKIPEFNAIDTGLFLCHRDSLKELKPTQDEELTWNTVKRMWLASGRPIIACDLQGLPWIDVDTPEDMAKAIDVIMSWAPSGKDGFVSRNLNRHISGRITRLLANTPTTPNQISIMSLLLAVAGSLLIARKAYVPGGLLVQLSSIIDGCDGEIARVRLQQSSQGAIFDSILDRWADSAVITGMALSTESRSSLLAGSLALSGSLLVPYSRARIEAELGQIPSSMLSIGMTRDVRLALLAIGSILRKPRETLLSIGLLSNLEVLRRLLQLSRAS